MKAIVMVNPAHIMLNPGKSNGALPDRNQSVRGENTSGEMTLAREHILDIIPWAFPCSCDATCLETMLRIQDCGNIETSENMAAIYGTHEDHATLRRNIWAQPKKRPIESSLSSFKAGTRIGMKSNWEIDPAVPNMIIKSANWSLSKRNLAFK
uniref:Uncharacterized protein n=1 Tax=Noccaea caerulescens TaxID=107243 RepID=A0A1J3C9J0_NOCCA